MNRPTRGFTLIEVVVVMSIITILLGMGIPGLINAQRRADRYATVNVLEVVHRACHGNARQMGATGCIYGFSLAFSNDAAVGTYTAPKIVPWVLGPSNNYQFNSIGEGSAAVGKEMMWNAASPVGIDFVDLNVPAHKYRVDGVWKDPVGVAAERYLHVGYEPGTGFVFVKPSGSATASIGVVSDMVGQKPNDLEVVVWNKGRKAAVNTFVIRGLGDSDVRLGQ